MTDEGFYHHEPGKLSRWGVVDVGLKCVHSCRFCYYTHLNGEIDAFAGMRKAPFHATEHLVELAGALKDAGFVGFDVTGGEPTLSPGIVSLVAEAERLGLAARIITLGQYLMRPMKSAPGAARLIDGLLEAGVADFLLSVHAVDEDRFRAITGESWAKQRAAMDHLDGLGVDYGTNTTVFEGNYDQTPAIAAERTRHRVYVANFIVMNAYYAWSRPGAETAAVQAHYGAVRPFLLEARDRLEAAGIAVNVRYAPLCAMRGLERNLVGVVGVRHDPHEWMNAIDHGANPQTATSATMRAMGARIALRDDETNFPLSRLPPEMAAMFPGIVAVRGNKQFPGACRNCAAMAVCDGIDANYLARRGAGELVPYAEPRGELIDRERLAYRAAFVVKTRQHGQPREAVRALLQDNTPIRFSPMSTRLRSET